MCAIAGIININCRMVELETLKNMLRVVSYRGPDDEGFLIGNTRTSDVKSTQERTFDSSIGCLQDCFNVAFGHRRLSILDLSRAGHQPMSNDDKTLWITYNGEIYNFVEIRRELENIGYRFKSGSDTEVILKAYEELGERCLERFNGMFAFAILDLRKKRLFCARDRIGIKPFYYYFDGNTFMFASEIKQLLENKIIKRIPDIEAIADYLLFQYVLGDKVFLKGVKKLLPAHYLSLDLSSGETKTFSYWDLDFVPDYSRKEEDFIEELKYLLRDSVRLQLRSDVPLGCHLSGGIDSSTVTCLASKLSPNRIKVFTGRFDLGEEYDESKWAKIVSNYTDAEYIEVTSDITKLNDFLHKIVWHLDEPVVGPGVFPQYVVSEIASRYVKVILGGQGGDELFGGYNWYNYGILRYIINNFNLGNGIFQNQSGFSFLIEFMKSKGIRSTLSELKSLVPGKPIERIYADICSIREESELKALINDGLKYSPKERFVEEFKQLRVTNPGAAIFKFDLKNYLHGLLQVEDRVSMAVSLESRVPILDHRIIELSSKLPLEFKVRNNRNKYLFRKSVKGIIPKEIVERRDKKGFPTPIHKFLDKKNYNFILPYLMTPLLKKQEVNRIYNEHLNGRQNNTIMLWRIINLGIWQQQFKV